MQPASTWQPYRNLDADPARARGCFTCAHFHGRFFYDYVLCEHRGGRQVIGTPRNGCCSWEREPGADDE